jgi:3'(2'), 5'-bisphosphate nucleotidase
MHIFCSVICSLYRLGFSLLTLSLAFALSLLISTMAAPTYSRERDIAELAVLRACVLTKKVLSTVDEISKSDLTPVTVADFAAQALLISAIEAAFPGHGVLGEEDATELRHDAKLREKVFGLVASVDLPTTPNGEGPVSLASPATAEVMMDMIDRGGQGKGGREGYYWIMDPVDGTKAFLEGHQYAVSLALMKDGKEVVGVMGCPNLKLQDGRVSETTVDKEGLGVIITAVKGHGATIRSVSANGTLSPREVLKTLPSPKSINNLHFVGCTASKALRQDIPEALARKLGTSDPGTNVWSSHMRYASLILGGGDLQIRVPRKNVEPVAVRVWDHAGSQLIFTELGGKVTDLDGKEMDFGAGRSFFNNRGVVVAKKEIHAEILALVRELLDEPKL